jgi:pimeloyl-ACP methyl ester carboxylesterase
VDTIRARAARELKVKVRAMRTPETGSLDVPGASIYYEVRGNGPALLVIPTGNGDATPFGPMADALADCYRVITYDRRGFSRSKLRAVADGPLRLRADVQDASRLLGHLAGGPAYVLGACSGAIVAIALLEEYPAQIRTLIAHEPPLTSLLPDAQRWEEFHAHLYDTYLTQGAEVAREIFKNSMGLAGQSRPPKGAELPAPQLAELFERLARNQIFWFEYEMRSYPAYLPDISVLKSRSDKLILAGGTASRENVPYRPNSELAKMIGAEVVHFPGGHLGYVTHPVEFAEVLTRVLRT